jgi:hypothetical protein
MRFTTRSFWVYTEASAVLRAAVADFLLSILITVFGAYQCASTIMRRAVDNSAILVRLPFSVHSVTILEMGV